jgi:hypothetical protein
MAKRESLLLPDRTGIPSILPISIGRIGRIGRIDNHSRKERALNKLKQGTDTDWLVLGG